jgi:hypothetical protein
VRSGRLWLLVLAGVGVVALILLAGGLSQVELLPGHPLPRRAQSENPLNLFAGAMPGSNLVGFLLVAMYLFALLLLPFAIVYFILSPDARRRVLRRLALLLWVLALYVLMRVRPDLFRALQLNPVELAPPATVNGPGVEFALNPPPWSALVVTIGLAVAIAAGLVAVGWFVWRRRHRPQGPLEQLAEQAREALDALRAGADLRDTVMRCYFEMNRALSQERGLRRDEAMTPREFEQELKQAGLPQMQVEELTRLFELVRYGARTPGEQEERQALACLAAVVEACRVAP